MTEITASTEERTDYGYQVPEKPKLRHAKNGHLSVASQHEALRRATLLKHRKVSTQLKLDMVQRQLAELRSSGASGGDRQFYRSQLSELSSELQDLGTTLEKVERSAFYARRRLLGGHGQLQLSASHPAIYSSADSLDHQSSKVRQKNRLQHLMSSPALKKKKHLLGELRAVASMSSLNVKPHPHDDPPSKDARSWRSPLRFLGSIILDNRISRRLLGSSRRIHKSSDHLDDGCKEEDGDFCGRGLRKDDDEGASSTETEDTSEDSEDGEEEGRVRRCAWKGPVERKVAIRSQQAVDPAVMAEIEDFEKMAAQYIKLHS